MRAFHARVVLLASLMFVLSLSVGAQTTANLEGTVRDASGAVLPRASVTATNNATGLTRSTLTSDSGTYDFVHLPVGDYTVTAEQKGFSKGTSKVHLDIGAAALLDFQLRVGQVSQEVEVTSEAAAVETTKTTLSSVIGEREIQTLPVNGRQFIDFALLAPRSEER